VPPGSKAQGPEKGLIMPARDSYLEKVEELIKIMKQNDLVELEVQNADGKILLKRATTVATGGALTPVPILAPPAIIPAIQSVSDKTPSPAAPSPSTHDGTLAQIKSPLVGTFYEKPSPDSEPYVQIGSHVEPQMVVCIIEAMKVMNEIKADVSGIIVDRLVKNGEAVEYGQPLFSVRLE
jgi:acetyl-CoA carboxylase biotin carboxyl carrier protein